MGVRLPVDFSQPVIVLAPMEGLTDPLMRDILTQIGNYHWCVSEFIRVTQHVLPAHVWYRYVPELLTNAKTASGTPIHVQILGSDANLMADNAAYACELGAPVIDINFGCPAKTVNRHRGGSVLLDEPETMYQIIAAVRRSVPHDIPVSAKIRLGYTNNNRTLEIGDAVEQARASWLTVHARTKTQGYKPPAYWHRIEPLTNRLQIPVFANGDIWTAKNASQCQTQSGTRHLMLGRGAVRRPDLINCILYGDSYQLNWQDLLPYQVAFLSGKAKNDTVLVGRYKQWLGMLTKGYDEASCLWQQIKKIKCKEKIIEKILMY